MRSLQRTPWKRPGLWEGLNVGEGNREKVRWVDGITNLMDMSLSKAPGVGDGQGSLVGYSPWGCKELDTTEQRK